MEGKLATQVERLAGLPLVIANLGVPPVQPSPSHYEGNSNHQPYDRGACQLVHGRDRGEPRKTTGDSRHLDQGILYLPRHALSIGTRPRRVEAHGLGVKSTLVDLDGGTR